MGTITTLNRRKRRKVAGLVDGAATSCIIAYPGTPVHRSGRQYDPSPVPYPKVENDGVLLKPDAQPFGRIRLHIGKGEEQEVASLVALTVQHYRETLTTALEGARSPLAPPRGSGGSFSLQKMFRLAAGHQDAKAHCHCHSHGLYRSASARRLHPRLRSFLPGRPQIGQGQAGDSNEPDLV